MEDNIIIGQTCYQLVTGESQDWVKSASFCKTSLEGIILQPDLNSQDIPSEVMFPFLAWHFNFLAFYFIMIQVISLATKYNPQYNWWIGLLEVGSGGNRIVNNGYLSWTYEHGPQRKLSKDSPLWSAGSPAYTDAFPVVGVILPSGLIADVTRNGSQIATDKMVFPICKLGSMIINIEKK